jgi:flagellar assembly protein FliH
MGSSERVLSGRACRSQVDPWAGQGRSWAVAAPLESGAVIEDPLRDPGVLARIAEATAEAARQGYADGRHAGEQELATAIAAAQGLARGLETAVPRDVEMVARTVAELAVLIARRIVAAELRHDPAVLVAAIETALRQAAGASVITVELHPDAVAPVEAAWTARHGVRHRGFSWSFAADPTMAVGGCRLRTEHGFVEAGFEGQLAEVAAALDASIPGYISSALGPSAERSDEGTGGGSTPTASSAAAPVTPPAARATAAVAAAAEAEVPPAEAPGAEVLDPALLAQATLSADDSEALGLATDGDA